MTGFIIAGIIGIVIGALVGWFVRQMQAKATLNSAEDTAKRIIEDAQKEAAAQKKTALLEAKDEWFRQKTKFDKETQLKREETTRLDQRIRDRENKLNQRVDLINRKETEQRNREKVLFQKEQSLEKKEEEYNVLINEQVSTLEKIAQFSRDEAKQYLIKLIRDEAEKDASQMVNDIRERAKATANREAKEIIVQAIQRIAADHTAETTVSVVNLPNEEMKGRIIGREGRNIRTFEQVTGVDVIIDDTPEAVVISAFDPVRREIARLALEKLILDGRIHPGRIEDVVEKAGKEVAEIIYETGEATLQEVGIPRMHPELIKLLGRLRYRTSYGQNVLQHVKECAFLGANMAAELGADVNLVKRACLLHDIGKAVDHNAEGTHVQIGVELAKRYGEPPVVVHAIAAHHEDVEPDSIIAVLVQASDAISGSRPGARRESIETYIQRLEALENIANNNEGVERTFAIQAGREIRVIVQPEQISDRAAKELAAKIAKKIEDELEYPGQVKVTVVREVRSVEYAK